MGLLAAFLAVAALATASSMTAAAAQDSGPSALSAMVETERAFAARATVVGWKQAFLEFFADDATGFDTGEPQPAKDSIRRAPDPPQELELLWEPRYGDVAASGDLGYLTGPVIARLPGREPRHQNYTSIWKRQADGTFRVVIDIGIPTPDAVPFPDGFTRASSAVRYTAGGAPADRTSLRDADRALTLAATKGQSPAYRGRLASGARLHRPGLMPLVGPSAILAWLDTQPPYADGESGYAEVAAAGDLGYTWGSYATAASEARPAERGHYARVWTRTADGTWTVALDVLQPAPPP